MSFLMSDEIDISKVDSLSRKRRDELAQKLKKHLRELRDYKSLFIKNQEANLKSKEKIVLGAYQELFSNLTTMQAIDKRMHQLLSYQKKLSQKSETSLDKPLTSAPESTYIPSYRKTSIAKKRASHSLEKELNQGEDLNELLLNAVRKDDKPLVDILLKRGANPSYISKKGSTPIDSAIKLKNYKILQLLRKYEKNFPNQRDVQKMKILMKTGGALGVDITLPLQSEDGQVTPVSSLGGYSHYSLPWLMHYLNQYCQKLKSEQQNDLYEIFRKILKAYSLAAKQSLLDPNVGLQTLLSAYKAGDPIFISGGWSGHNIGIALYRKELGFVDRGVNQYYGTGFFEVSDPAKVNEAWIASLQSLKANGPEVMNNIAKLAGNNPISFIESSVQKLGTCYYANPKSSVELFLYWLSLESGLSEKEARAFALAEYKNFTEFTRNQMCHELIDLYQHHPEDREFYEKLFEGIIKTHHGETVRPTSRDLAKKLYAELNRAAMLIQTMVQVDKHHAYEFLQKLGPVGETLKGLAKDEFFSNEVPQLKEALNACGFLEEYKPPRSHDRKK